MTGKDSEAGTSAPSIRAVRLTRDAYRPYGDIICADETLPFRPANNGTAKRFNFLSDVENLRGAGAKLNLCVFRCAPLKQLPLELKLLEKHPHSTQVFMPMNKDARFLTIVCLGGDKPDLSSLAAFLTEGAQGVSYKPGVWHYPMTALEEQIDFSCLVWEDDTTQDCEINMLEQSIFVDI